MLVIKLYFEAGKNIYSLTCFFFSLSLSLSHIQMEQPVTDNMQHTGLNTTHRDQNIDADIPRDKTQKHHLVSISKYNLDSNLRTIFKCAKYWPNTRANMLTPFCTWV